MSSFNDKICITKQNTVNFSINILTHCTFLLAIICTVFFLFTEKIMSNAINSNIEDLATDAINDYYYNSTPENKKTIDSALQYAQLETLLKIHESSTEDRYFNNTWIEKLFYVIVGLLIIIVIFIVLTVKAQCGKISIIEILSENIIIFIFVGVVEFLFFTKIIIKYIPVYPSTLTNIFVQELKNYTPP
jgi:hypothetical protein